MRDKAFGAVVPTLPDQASLNQRPYATQFSGLGDIDPNTLQMAGLVTSITGFYFFYLAVVEEKKTKSLVYLGGSAVLNLAACAMKCHLDTP
jgi:hypothetical protein